jgi:amino acid adenylation domain-containing protein
MVELAEPIDTPPPRWGFVEHRRVGPTNAFADFKKADTEQSIPARFEQQVARYPDRLAVKTSRHALTYAELDWAANCVARAILAQDERRGAPVALLFDDDTRGVAAVIGALKSGSVSAVLDASQPVARLCSILEDLQASLILTDNKHLALAQQLSGSGVQLINVDGIDDPLPSAHVDPVISPDTLAFILYTSGSTGQPNGVVHTHGSVLHTCMRHTNSLHICPDDRVSHLRTLASAGSAQGILITLLNGASLHLFNLREEGVTNLADWLIEEEITVHRSTPTVFRHLLRNRAPANSFASVRLVNLQGEPVHRSDVELYKSHFCPSCLLLNGYGCTEFPTFSRYFIDHNTEIPGDTVPVGYPDQDTQVLLLDDDGQPVGVGRVGEIVVKSRYLALGYWRKRELTAATFLPDPRGGSERIYRTGDLGRLGPDGCLEHLGRKDFQIKLRGNRVELAEVELALRALPGVRDAVVVARADRRGDQRLVAYVVAEGAAAATTPGLRQGMRDRLPEYMVPTAFVLLGALPMTPGGKIDRHALPAPDWEELESEAVFVAPRTPLEELLAGIWAHVLGLPRVGIHDDFMGLGGDSLKASRVVSRVPDTLRQKLSMASLLAAPTVAQQAAELLRQLTEQVSDDETVRLLEEIETLPGGRIEGRHQDQGAG